MKFNNNDFFDENNFYIIASSLSGLPVRNIRQKGIIYGNDFENFTDIQRFRSLNAAKTYLHFSKFTFEKEDLSNLHIFLFTKKDNN